MKLTIGIPVFNVERTLRRCLDFVLDQKGIKVPQWQELPAVFFGGQDV